MNDLPAVSPKILKEIQRRSSELNFSMPSDLQTGSLLRTLAASKPGGSILEIGTGTGLSLSWLIEGMDQDSTIISIDNSPEFQQVAQDMFADDHRLTFVCEDAKNWILNNQDKRFDLIFADAWPGKYEILEETLSLLKKGGLYIIDDMLPQPNWPAGHDENAEQLVEKLAAIQGIQQTRLNWSTGLIVISKV
ncbi:methyltransferase domain-containing protein [Pedobacter sp. HMF7647]|uniref:Methyltransferase domain-containing protein n=1 Tax=Hufsiella arboris TaxID=2695275 RepID=A0A7K1YDX7_9SPHI|nr:methyltransferase domain-containing protein [Hufsiella arboris]MXV52806.1 methyltransferase domain-containing protein [Hufsiella arboris]